MSRSLCLIRHQYTPDLWLTLQFITSSSIYFKEYHTVAEFVQTSNKFANLRLFGIPKNLHFVLGQVG